MINEINNMNKKRYVQATLLTLLSYMVIAMFSAVLFMVSLSAESVYSQWNAETILSVIISVFLVICVLLYLMHVYVTYKRMVYVKCKKWTLVFSLIGLHIIPFLVAVLKADTE